MDRDGETVGRDGGVNCYMNELKSAGLVEHGDLLNIHQYIGVVMTIFFFD
jgi:hypothetical protein